MMAASLRFTRGAAITALRLGAEIGDGEMLLLFGAEVTEYAFGAQCPLVAMIGLDPTIQRLWVLGSGPRTAARQSTSRITR